jgi:hypothetical protein
MRRDTVRGPRRRILLTGLVLVGFVSAGSATDEASPPVFRGACYCRAQGELTCTAGLTAAECDLRSKHALCDDWFWKERLACWNWGYGG